VSTIDPVDPDNPFSSRFTITNTGFIALENVSVGIAPGKIDWGGDAVLRTEGPLSDKSHVLMSSNWQNHELRMDEPYTITPSDVFSPRGVQGPDNRPIQSADIAIIVTYQPWFIPWSRSRAFRFQARRGAAGKFLWYSVPLK
jgi:hypothetical protein